MKRAKVLRQETAELVSAGERRLDQNRTLKGESLYENLLSFETTSQLDKLHSYLNTFKPSKTMPS